MGSCRDQRLPQRDVVLDSMFSITDLRSCFRYYMYNLAFALVVQY